MKPVLELNGVCKNFGGVVAAKDVDIKVYPGAIRGLIGPNGAGKTTILNLISGIYPVDAGRITFLDKDITKMAPYNRARMGLGRTFQAPRFLQRSSIKDNLLLATDLNDQMGFFNSFMNKKGADFKKDLSTLMEVAGFEFDEFDSISALPYGQRKLLEIVRTMLTNPKAMLVDEPAAGLNDAEIERAVALLKLATSRGTGVVLIEHRMDMVMNNCDEITVLNFGRVICDNVPSVVSKDAQVIEAYLGKQREEVC
ncbi:MAG: ABC transporter ATP-binding protein [Christensenellales bacterium]|jgi:branched-chain amino acid transport system ATP-binding protein